MSKSKPAYPNLRAYFKATGCTQVEFARLVGIQQPYISKVLRGAQSPSLEMAVRIAAIADIPVDTLIKTTTKKKVAA